MVDRDGAVVAELCVTLAGPGVYCIGVQPATLLGSNVEATAPLRKKSTKSFWISEGAVETVTAGVVAAPGEWS